MEDIGDIKDLKDLGDFLRTRRVALGLSIEEVHTTTKIRQHHLVAMEAGDFDALPGEVYVRGFLRTYAGCIGLDGERLVERYRAVRGRILPSDRALGEAVGAPELVSKFAPGKEKGKGRVGLARVADLRRMMSPVTLAVATIVVIGGIVIHIIVPKPSGEGERPRAQAPPQATAAVVTTPRLGGSAAPASSEGVPPPQGLEPEVGQAGPPGPAEPAAKIGQSGQTDSQAPQEPAPEQAPSPRVQGAQESQLASPPPTAGVAPAVAPAEAEWAKMQNGSKDESRNESKAEQKHESGHEVRHELKVDITERCWVRVVADGRVVFEKVMNPGDSRTWTARERLRIKAGNAAGIALTYNGSKLEFSGRPGQVREWSFPQAQR